MVLQANGAGLTTAQAAERLAVDGPNALPGDTRRTLLGIARETLREPMFLLLLAANPQWLGLPGAGALSSFAVLIA